jgi:putative Holliday junction resolvase
MGRILAIDFGLKRTGIAVTDPLKIIASALTTVPTENNVKVKM